MQYFPLSGVITREFLRKELDFCREKLQHLPLTHPRREVYEAALARTVLALSEHYTTQDLPRADGLLLHGSCGYWY